MTSSRVAPARRRLLPGQGRLLIAALAGVLGALLPWLYTPAGTLSGMRGPGLWTFYAAMLAVAGGLVPHRMLAAGQGLLFALVAVVLPVWQVLHVLQLVGTQGWLPGPGLVMTLAAAVIAFIAARQLYAERPA